MTTAPTPSEKVQRLAITLEIVGAVPDMNYVTVTRHVARDASVELRRLQADNERLRAELEARKPLPLSDEQIEGLREQTFSTNNPFCPCDSKTMRKAVRAAERAHGITGGSS